MIIQDITRLTVLLNIYRMECDSMNKKMLISWFSVYLCITFILIYGITVLDRADDERQFAKNAVAEAETTDNKKIDNENFNADSSTNTNLGVNADSENSVSSQKNDEFNNDNASTSGEEFETINVDDVVVHMGKGKADRVNVGARIYADVDPDKPMVALTFDDGPDIESTNRILDALDEYGARATFFVVGYKITEAESTIKRAYDIGCEIGSHTYNHVDLTTLNKSQRMAQINNTEKLITAITGQRRVLLRPPYGAVNGELLKEVDTPIILWSIDTEDWITRDIQNTVENVLGNVEDGSIILMHDSYAETADATVEIIKQLTDKGYQLVTVSELGYHKFGGLAKGVKYGAMYGDE